MNDTTMHLPEIADTLCSKGFSVEIAWNHHSIVVGLNRNISVDEVEAACDYEIDDDVTIVATGDGKVYLQE